MSLASLSTVSTECCSISALKCNYQLWVEDLQKSQVWALPHRAPVLFVVTRMKVRSWFYKTKKKKKKISITEIPLLLLLRHQSVRNITCRLFPACLRTRPPICFHPMASYATQTALKCVHLEEFIVTFRPGTSQPTTVGREGGGRAPQQDTTPGRP